MEKIEYAGPIPTGVGDTLETIGSAMILLTLIMGAVALFTLGKVTTVERAFYGVREVTEWSPAAIAMVLVSTAWSAMLSFAVMRLGTALRWLESIGRRDATE